MKRSLRCYRRGDSEIRPLTWGSAAQAVAARPWIGWGLSSFDLALVDHATPSFIARMNENVACRGQVIDRAHNLGWELLVEVGAPGFVLWLMMMALFVDVMLSAAAGDVENRNLIFAGVLALLSYVIHQLFNPSDLGKLDYFLVCAGLDVGAQPAASRETESVCALHNASIFDRCRVWGGIWIMDVDRDVKKVETFAKVQRLCADVQRNVSQTSEVWRIFFIVRVPFQRVAVVALMLMR